MLKRKIKKDLKNGGVARRVVSPICGEGVQSRRDRTRPFFNTFIILLIAIIFFAGPALAKKKSGIMPSEQAVFHNNQGISFLNKQDLAKSEFEFKTAIELAPQFAEPYNNLGLIYKIKGQYDLALSQFRKAAELDKTYASPYNHIAAVYLALGDLEAALKAAKKAAKTDSLMADAHYNLGLVWLEKSKKEQSAKALSNAQTEFEKTTVLNPNLEPVHIRLAEIYRDQKKYDLAIVRYRLALNISNAPDVWESLGNLYLEMGDSFKAQNCFQKAIELKPDTEDSHLQLGIFYLNQKRNEEALSEFQKVIELNPKNEKAFFSIGALKMEQGQIAEAMEHFKKAKMINPNFADAIYNLGVVLNQMGKTDQAKQEWEYVVTIAPEYSRAYHNLALLSAKLGKMDIAGQHYCSFLKSAKGQFPTEESLAKTFLEEYEIKCQK